MTNSAIELSQRQKWWLKVILTIFTAVLTWSFIRSYVKLINSRDDEEIAMAATLGIIGCLFAGRFLSLLWINNKGFRPGRLLIMLPVLMIIFLVFLTLWASILRDHPTAIMLLLLILFSVGFCLCLGMFIKLVRHNIYSRIREADTAAVNSRSELQLLQSQLSPHFLFNTLNNLYGVSLSRPEKVPPLLLKLSDLLRYSVYDARESFVPLRHELDYLKNFIDFEKMRIGDRLELKVQMEEINGLDMEIAPMLLIVFLENAFKHAKDSADERIFIEIALKTWGSSLLFSVKNSHHKSAALPGLGAPKSGGIGLENVRKRLELLYPENFNVEIQDEERWYTVMLRLKLR